MRVRYIGPHTDGVIVSIGGHDWPCGHGDTLDVPDDIAASLLEQPTNWEPVKPAKPKTVPSEED